MEAVNKLLKRPPPLSYLKEWERLLAEKKEVFVDKRDVKSFLLFRIEERFLGINVSIVKEVFTKREIQKIPNRTEDAFEGISVVSGKLVLCFSLPTLFKDIFGVFEEKKSKEKYMISLDIDGALWAFSVSEVFDISSAFVGEEEDFVFIKEEKRKVHYLSEAAISKVLEGIF